MKKLVIFGARAFAEMAHYYFATDSDYSVVAFTVDASFLREPTFKDLPIVPFEEVEDRYPPGEHEMFVAVGFGAVNRHRAEKTHQAESKGYRLASYLSSGADAPGLVLEANTMVMKHARLHPFVTVGRDTVIWSESRIGFRSHIGDHCWIVSAILGESVDVGDYTFIGLNATIGPSISIGRSNVIGAGALVLKDTKDSAVLRSRGDSPSGVPSHRLWPFRPSDEDG